MAKFELKLPKMGESVAEATLTNWLKNIGDTIEADEAVLEIATDKVDSEVPSEVDGVLVERLFEVDDVIQVGQTIAVIETKSDISENNEAEIAKEASPSAAVLEKVEAPVVANSVSEAPPVISSEDRFYSPLVKNIAATEGVSQGELDAIIGTGKDGRVTKNDILAHLESRGVKPALSETTQAPKVAVAAKEPVTAPKIVSVNGQDEIIEMTRMGKLIAHHMVESVQTSAHVQSFIEVEGCFYET